MTIDLICPGLPASWINGWLAGVGATILDARIRLHWSSSQNVAVLSATEHDPVDLLLESWPDEQSVADLPISEYWRGEGELERKVDVEDFAVRARAARTHSQSWALSSTMTDLCVDKDGQVAHAPLDPAGPGTIKWLHHRLSRLHSRVPAPTATRLRDSLMGFALREKDNGLGFDQTRLGSRPDRSEAFTDPVVEVMAFFGLALLPMRGRGTDARLDRSVFADQRQRGWRRSGSDSNARRFIWPAWSQPLGADGIDALLDVWNVERKRRWPLVGVHAAWQSVAYRSLDRADPTRAFGAERM